MRLTEKYMDPPGQAGHARTKPDRGTHRQQHGNADAAREQGNGQYADQFKGFDWKTEEDAFMDGYHNHEKGGQFVTYERLRAMGTNGFQEPATDFKDGKIVGTTGGCSPDGKFNSKRRQGQVHGDADGAGCRRRARRTGDAKKWPFLINNGRTNVVWQSAYLDSGQ